MAKTQALACVTSHTGLGALQGQLENTLSPDLDHPAAALPALGPVMGLDWLGLSPHFPAFSF